MCQDAAAEAIIELKKYGPGGISITRQSLMDCLAACSSCNRWEHEEKGFFAKALKQDIKLMEQKLEEMEKNWHWGDGEMSRIRRRAWEKEWCFTGMH